MQTEPVAKQILAFQQTTFENAFNTMVMFQDQAERITQSVLDQITWLPKEGKETLDEWTRLYRTGRDDFKAMIDSGFEQLADICDDQAAIYSTPKSTKAAPAKSAAK